MPYRRLITLSFAFLAFALVAASAVTSHAARDGVAGDHGTPIPYTKVETAAGKSESHEPAAHGEEAEAEHAEAGHATEENVGFPQLKPASFPSQIFWLVVSFTLLYFLMSKVALPGVAQVIETRAAQQEGNLSQAASMQSEAEGVKTAYEASVAKARASAQEVIAAAEQDISERIQAENAKFGEHARKRVATAEQAIEKAKAEALSSIADISAEISAEIVGKVSGITVTKNDTKKAVTTVMKKEAA
ncbi:MAG: ATPase [Alphaproteobacteria bacterium]